MSSDILALDIATVKFSVDRDLFVFFYMKLFLYCCALFLRTRKAFSKPAQWFNLDCIALVVAAKSLGPVIVANI